MKALLRRAVPAAIGVVVCLLPFRAAAEERSSLVTPTVVASAAAAADWASTYHALKYYRVRESNPLLQPFQQSPAALVSVGALIDVGTVSGWNLFVGRTHPRIAAAGLWGMAAFRTYLALHNLHNERIAARR
jgi:hypothetical protein